jgi:hypothetical protein
VGRGGVEFCEYALYMPYAAPRVNKNVEVSKNVEEIPLRTVRVHLPDQEDYQEMLEY